MEVLAATPVVVVVVVVVEDDHCYRGHPICYFTLCPANFDDEVNFRLAGESRFSG